MQGVEEEEEEGEERGKDRDVMCVSMAKATGSARWG